MKKLLNEWKKYLDETKQRQTVDIEQLQGQVFDFYGAEDNVFKLDDKVYEAIENPDDGYRSYLGSTEVLGDHNFIFYRTPVAKVKVVMVDYDSFVGYKLIDVDDGHCWLSVGTNHTDDYYPMFVFRYEAKSPKDPDAEYEDRLIADDAAKLYARVIRDVEDGQLVTWEDIESISDLDRDSYEDWFNKHSQNVTEYGELARLMPIHYDEGIEFYKKEKDH